MSEVFYNEIKLCCDFVADELSDLCLSGYDLWRGVCD